MTDTPTATEIIACGILAASHTTGRVREYIARIVADPAFADANMGDRLAALERAHESDPDWHPSRWSREYESAILQLARDVVQYRRDGRSDDTTRTISYGDTILESSRGNHLAQQVINYMITLTQEGALADRARL